MPMIKANEVTPRQIRAVLPDEYANRGYVKLEKGMTIEIESMVFSIYQATKKNVDGSRINMETTDGKPITNTTVYLGLTDGRYTSVNGDVATCQMASIVGFKETEIGKYPFVLDQPETVSVIEVTEKMGNKDYPKIAFE